MLLANPKHLHNWKIGAVRQRFDYDTPDHLLSEITHPEYWSTVMVEIEAGDLIHVTDAAQEGATIRIDWKDAAARTVGTSLVERVTERPLVPAGAITIKNRGPRGGFWCVVDAEGNVLVRDLKTQDDAERHRKTLTETKAAA